MFAYPIPIAIVGSGKLAILVRNDLKFSIHPIETDKSQRVHGIQLQGENSDTLYVFGVYLPSDTDLENYTSCLNNLQDIYSFYSQKGNVIIGDDFNAQYNTVSISSTLQKNRCYSETS